MPVQHVQLVDWACMRATQQCLSATYCVVCTCCAHSTWSCSWPEAFGAAYRPSRCASFAVGWSPQLHNSNQHTTPLPQVHMCSQASQRAPTRAIQAVTARHATAAPATCSATGRASRAPRTPTST
jgi:hypothetical protein